jgi:hypothetical protein
MCHVGWTVYYSSTASLGDMKYDTKICLLYVGSEIVINQNKINSACSSSVVLRFL